MRAAGVARSEDDAHFSYTPGPTFAFVGGPHGPTLDFAFAFWIMIASDTLLPLAVYRCNGNQCVQGT